MKLATAIKKLAKMGIKTMADLDKWSLANPRNDKFGRPFIMSRFKALKELVGENAAIGLLHELSIKECCKAI